MDPKKLLKQYKAVFGKEPDTFSLPDDTEGIYKNMAKAIQQKRPLWSFYFDQDPNDLPGADL